MSGSYQETSEHDLHDLNDMVAHLSSLTGWGEHAVHLIASVSLPITRSLSIGNYRLHLVNPKLIRG